MSCNCNTLNPDCEMNRWESCPSVIIADAENYYTKAEVDEIIEHLDPGGCCCPKMIVSGHKLIFTDTDDCVYVEGHKLIIGG